MRFPQNLSSAQIFFLSSGLQRLNHLMSFVYLRFNIVVLSRVQHFETPWTIAGQDPLSVELSRQEYWSGLPFPPPGDLSDPGIEPASLVSPTLAGRFLTTEPPGKAVFKQKPWSSTPSQICLSMLLMPKNDQDGNQRAVFGTSHIHTLVSKPSQSHTFYLLNFLKLIWFSLFSLL